MRGDGGRRALHPRPIPYPRPVRWPWGATGTAAATAAAGTEPWWRSVAVPRARRPEDLLGGGSAVPVTGPAARDGDGDGVPDTLVVDTPAGTWFWTDLDGDGLADRVVTAGDPVDDLLTAVLDGTR
ncbi:hypothetical protein H7X46_26395 [Pseudonocardia sp. C8]|uniref:DUF6802 family protein n=1 Tax=Pseudonocardia sp. C8 TaxID=2762759 RepID=UPI00164246F4|nr:DUF6802 family protein [Pseudonocardia sp. C8]MBC3194584.1 hypothetical protein [Pseudonocardia sp. C8]